MASSRGATFGGSEEGVTLLTLNLDEKVKDMGWVPSAFPPLAVLVKSVAEGSWAQEHGVEVEDVLQRIYDHDVAGLTKNDLKTFIKSRPLEVTFARGPVWKAKQRTLAAVTASKTQVPPENLSTLREADERAQQQQPQQPQQPPPKRLVGRAPSVRFSEPPEESRHANDQPQQQPQQQHVATTRADATIAGAPAGVDNELTSHLQALSQALRPQIDCLEFSALDLAQAKRLTAWARKNLLASLVKGRDEARQFDAEIKRSFPVEGEKVEPDLLLEGLRRRAELAEQMLLAATAQMEMRAVGLEDALLRETAQRTLHPTETASGVDPKTVIGSVVR